MRHFTFTESLFPEYVQKPFETERQLRHRTIVEKMTGCDAKTGSRVAWVRYRAKAYDLACTLFLAHLRANLSHFKYRNALESAAARCGRIPQVLEAYRSHETHARKPPRTLQDAGAQHGEMRVNPRPKKLFLIQESDYVNTFEPKMSRRAEQTNIV